MTDVRPSPTKDAPYFDDSVHANQSGYHRILFRPGYSPQARELTQAQTIQQNQIGRIGDGLFKDGSLVTGNRPIVYQGDSENIQHLNLASSYIASTFENKIIVSQTPYRNHYARAYVLATQESNSSEPATLIIKPLNNVPFLDGASICIRNDTANSAVLANNCSGPASVVSIHEGTYYYNQFFIHAHRQTIVLDKYDNTPTYRIGLEFDDSIVESGSDTTLLDPALGTDNYQAPGADRYQIILTLSKRDLFSTDDTNFIDLMHVENGKITMVVKFPIFSDLERTLAHRTFNESGNYTVKPFHGAIKEHVADFISGTITATGTSVVGANTKFLSETPVGSIISACNQSALVSAVSDDTHLTLANNMTTPVGTVPVVANPNDFTLMLTKGHAYIHGHEFKTITHTPISLKKGRDIAPVRNYELECPIGNYLITTGVNGIPDIGQEDIYDLHYVTGNNINFVNSTAYAATVIGNTRVRFMEYSGAISTDPTTEMFYTYLFDTQISSNTYSFANTAGLGIYQNAGNTSFNKSMTVSSASQIVPVNDGKTANSTFLTDADFNILVFPYPQSAIQAGSTQPANTSISYYSQGFQANITFTNGVGSVTLPSYGSATAAFLSYGTDVTNLQNFTLTVRNSSGVSGLSNGQILPMIAANGRSISVAGTTATLNANTGGTFTGDVLYSFSLKAPVRRTKTWFVANTSNVMQVGGTSISSSSSNVTVWTTNNVVQVQFNKKHSGITPGNSSSLYVSDAQLVQILDFNGNSLTENHLSLATDVTDQFIFDNGQRDNYYSHASITPKNKSKSIIGPLMVYLNYYSHSGYGFLDVNSYPDVNTDAGYNAIPQYKSPTSGVVYNLRDCVDWRPKRLNATTSTTLVDDDTGSLSTIISPFGASGYISSYAYYLGRMDLVTLTKDRTFRVIEGIPGLYPSSLNIPPIDMLLYTVFVPPYTFDLTDVKIQFNDNKRYTMDDIGKINEKVKQLEYFTALSLLEQSTENEVVLDSQGFVRPKNAILVDNFTGNDIGDVSSYDYSCSIDYENGVLYPMFYANNYSCIVAGSPAHSLPTVQNPFVHDYVVQDSVLYQPAASTTETINPFGMGSSTGRLFLYPDTGTWYDRTTRPDVLTNSENQHDNYVQIGSEAWDTRLPGFGFRFNEWMAQWFGISTNTINRNSLLQQDIVTRSTPSTSDLTIPIDFMAAPDSIIHKENNKFTDKSVRPYVASADISIAGVGLLPFTTVYPFINGLPVQAYWANANKIVIDPTQTPVANALSFASGYFEQLVTTSGGTGTLVLAPSATSVSNNTISGMLHVTNMQGTWSIGDRVTGQISGAQIVIGDIIILTDTVANNTSNLNQLNLNTSARHNPDKNYANNLINIVKGQGAGQISLITSYDSTNNIVTVSPAWNKKPGGDAVYSIGSPMTTGVGTLAGTLTIPTTAPLKFHHGQLHIKITDSPTNDPEFFLTKARGVYHVDGHIEAETHSDDNPDIRPAHLDTEGADINITGDPVSQFLTPNFTLRPSAQACVANNLTLPQAVISVVAIANQPNTDAGGGFYTANTNAPIFDNLTSYTIQSS
jgi:hypothetical protein